MRWRALFPAASPRGVVLVTMLAAASCFGCGIAIAFSHADRVSALSPILGLAAIAAGLLVAGERGGLGISGGFIVAVLAAALLGPASAVAASALSEITATLTMRTRAFKVLLNMPPALVSAVVPAVLVEALTRGPADQATFYLVVALSGVASLLVSFTLFTVLRRAA
ncbi:MAG: hypothetical protein ACYC0H_22245, partial [Solirubrobacteraceae bacterium]